MRAAALLALLGMALSARAQAPELIFHNGKVLTVDNNFSVDATNNKFVVSVNGITGTVTVPPKDTYTLGTFMEGMSMVITTIPLLFPVVKALGYDPIWFGVIVTMLVEIAQISPPDGTVMYVLQGMRSRPGPITDVFAGVMPDGKVDYFSADWLDLVSLA